MTWLRWLLGSEMAAGIASWRAGSLLEALGVMTDTWPALAGASEARRRITGGAIALCFLALTGGGDGQPTAVRLLWRWADAVLCTVLVCTVWWRYRAALISQDWVAVWSRLENLPSAEEQY